MNSYQAHVLTLFPEMFPGSLGHSVTGRALENKLWSLDAHNIRAQATDTRKTVDDVPYGGGAGMVMKPDVVAPAIRNVRKLAPKNAPVVFLAPTGERFNQKMAREFSELDGIILLCGHYEGIDQRVIDSDVDRVVSLGDFVISGGEPAALVMLDSIVRLLPNVLGADASLHEESFDIVDENGEILVEYPHYTRPKTWEEQEVPEILRSGNHGEIAKWRLEQAKKRTSLLKTVDGK